MLQPFLCFGIIYALALFMLWHYLCFGIINTLELFRLYLVWHTFYFCEINWLCNLSIGVTYSKALRMPTIKYALPNSGPWHS
jgi:hypothetical protein